MLEAGYESDSSISFIRYKHNINDHKSIGGDEIYSIYEDRSGIIWIGTNNGLSRYLRDDEIFINYTHDPADPRSITSNEVYSIYEEGASFTMASRFRTNQNLDLPASASFVDFRDINFSNPSTVQIHDAIVSRNGVFDSADSNIIPNLTKGELASSFIGNKGIANTFGASYGRIRFRFSSNV